MNIKSMVAAVTIFDEQGEVSETENRKLYNHLISNKVDGIVILGSTGEFASTSLSNKKRLIDIAVSEIANRCRLLVGTGGMSVDEVIYLSQYAYEKGAKEVIIIPPYYFKLDEESILSFYSQIAQKISAKIFIYNFPAVTGYDVSPKIVTKLLKQYSNIIGYKDTISDMWHTREIIRLGKDVNSNFEVYSGYDDNIASVALSGGAGLIGALLNVEPSLFVDMGLAFRNGKLEEISMLQKKIDHLMDVYKMQIPPALAMKAILKEKGIISSSYCNEPVKKISDAEIAHVVSLFD